MRPVVGAVKPQLVYPVPEDPGVLMRAQMWRVVQSAREEVVLGFQASPLDPRLHGVSSSGHDLELNRALGLMLVNDRA